MNTHYSIDLKRKLCQDICLNGKSTLQTANEFGIPLKTLEKWIIAFSKNNHCFDDKIQNVDFKLTDSFDENAAQKSFHALLKKECIYQHQIYTFEDAYKYIYDYIERFYNPIRIHSSIGYLSPNQFESRL